MDYIVTENPFVESDQEFIYHEHDFVSLEDIEESGLDQIMHRMMGHAKSGIIRVRSQRTQSHMSLTFIENLRESSRSSEDRGRERPLLLRKPSWRLDQDHHCSRLHSFAFDTHLHLLFSPSLHQSHGVNHSYFRLRLRHRNLFVH